MPIKTTILGSGAMGTACALLLSQHDDQRAAIWGHNHGHIDSIRQTRCNERLLPDIAIPDEIEVTSDIHEAVADADFLVATIPSKHLRESLTKLAPSIPANIPVVSVVKGIEVDTFYRPSQIIRETIGDRPVIALSGPSHAEEIALKLPASVVAACEDLELAKTVQHMFSTDRFRIYSNQDLVGVELAGAIKNIVGIAAGISDGLGYGDNAKAALLTRAIVEMSRFGESQGADPNTFPGLAGVGDVITTCCSPHGRNRRVGMRLGLGESLEEIMNTMEQVAEGVTTCRAVHQRALAQRIDMPITAEVHAVLFEGKSAAAATDSLMSRPYKQE